MKTLGAAQNFLGLEKDRSAFESSAVVILPAPYEYTVSYGHGTKNGPAALLKASHYTEFYDEETRRDVAREFGIATLPALTFAKKRDRAALALLEKTVSSLIQRGKFVVTLGGEHTISSATVAAHAKRYPDLSVVQFDAHSDLRDSYHGNKYSHACVMARVAEIIDPRRLVQVGIRAQCEEEAQFIREKKVNTFYAHAIRGGHYTTPTTSWADAVVSCLTESVYITFDVDGFDPSIMPSTGTPEPNGLFWSEVMECLKKIGHQKHVVGFDVVELAPQKGIHHPDLTAAKLVSKILNYAL
jgi:agmatinase